MEDFLNSERFEQMAREYNAKYRQANVLENVSDRTEQKGIEENIIEKNENLVGEDSALVLNDKIANSQNSDLFNEDYGSLQEDSCVEIAKNKKVVEVLCQIVSLVKLCERKTFGNVRFLSTNNMGEKLLERIHKIALDNDFLLDNGQGEQNFWGNNKIFVQKFIKIEKFFAKNKEIAKVQCLCGIHEMLLEYMDSFYGRI